MSRAMSCYPELMRGNEMSRFPQRGGNGGEARWWLLLNIFYLVLTTRAQDKKRERDLDNRKYAVPHQVESLETIFIR